MKIEGKHIVLTGASSGIGLELLKLFAQYNNVKIVAVARNIKTIPKNDGIVFPFSADLSRKEEVDAMFNYATSVLGGIDIFVANAGFAYMEKLGNADWEHIENIFSLNTFSPIYSLQKLGEGDPTGNKYFVCISSAVSTVPLPYYSLYCSTKSAIDQFLRTYRYEADSRLSTMTVYPVATKTDFFRRAADSDNPKMPFLTQTPLTVAKRIVKGIERNKRKVYPSVLFRLFHTLGSIFPFLLHVYSWNEKTKTEKVIRK